ncbi:MAG: hypothetical protein MUO64_00225 [Anaerolineales bacterium]|jgi:hypothetical protein|nr:hypothetical protein [Anaerolineales bacterium]
MNYNSETINNVSEKLAEMFKTAVIAEQQNDQGAPMGRRHPYPLTGGLIRID